MTYLNKIIQHKDKGYDNSGDHLTNIRFTHDHSYNLLEHNEIGKSHAAGRLFSSSCSNRFTTKKPETGQNSFDRNGNRLLTPTISQLSWTPSSMLQIVKLQSLGDGQQRIEYYVYAGKQRTRKVTETKDNDGKVIKIRISEYFGKLEKQTTYAASNQKHPQLVVNEQELKTYSTSIIHHLYIKIGHRQIARQSTCNLEHSTVNLEFHLSNHIDSSQAILTSSGELKSFQSFYPYGNTSFQYGQLKDKNYQYSGEEKDDTGLHYYGARYYNSENLLSWLSPDPAGYPDGHLNRYTMVKGNPVTRRDVGGMMTSEELQIVLETWRKKEGLSKLSDIVMNLLVGYAKNHLYAFGEKHSRYNDKVYLGYILNHASYLNGSKFHRFFVEKELLPIISTAIFSGVVQKYKKFVPNDIIADPTLMDGFYTHEKGYNNQIIENIDFMVQSAPNLNLKKYKKLRKFMNMTFISSASHCFHDKVIVDNKNKYVLNVERAAEYIKITNQAVSNSFHGSWKAARSLSRPNHILGIHDYVYEYGKVLADFLEGYGECGFAYVGAGHFFDSGGYYHCYKEGEGAFGFLDKNMMSFAYINSNSLNFFSNCWKSKENWNQSQITPGYVLLAKKDRTHEDHKGVKNE